MSFDFLGVVYVCVSGKNGCWIEKEREREYGDYLLRPGLEIEREGERA